MNKMELVPTANQD